MDGWVDGWLDEWIDGWLVRNKTHTYEALMPSPCQALYMNHPI